MAKNKKKKLEEEIAKKLQELESMGEDENGHTQAGRAQEPEDAEAAVRDAEEEARIKFRKRVRRMIVLSVLAHVAFGGVAATVVAFRTTTKPQATFEGDPPPQQRMEPRKLEMKVKVTDLQKRSARPRLNQRLVAQRPSDIALPELKKDPQKMQKVKKKFSTIGRTGIGSGIGGGLGSGAGGGGGAGMSADLPLPYAGRCTKHERIRRLKRYGGTEKCEELVIASLNYLKSTQKGNGSWGNKHPVGMTGLGLLVFLAHCETPDSAEYGKTVQSAIDYLYNKGKAADGLMHSGGAHSQAYEHGIATFALAEAQGLIETDYLLPLLESSAKIIFGGQKKRGGWDYTYAGSKERNDTSVSLWNIQALKACKLAGVKATAVTKGLNNAMDNLKYCQNSDGSIGYTGPLAKNKDDENKEVADRLTGGGAYGLQIWKKGSRSAERKALDYIIETREGMTYQSPQATLYEWYYNTLAFFTAGSKRWEFWRDLYLDEIINAANGDGTYAMTGSGKENRAGDSAHYRTCLNTLMLEVFYRYSSEHM